MHAERDGWSPEEIARAAATNEKGLPRIDFIAEAQICPIYTGPLKIQKSRTRTVITVAGGAFEAREVLKQCTAQKSGCVPVGSEALSEIVKPRQPYGYDLVVQVVSFR